MCAKTVGVQINKIFEAAPTHNVLVYAKVGIKYT